MEQKTTGDLLKLHRMKAGFSQTELAPLLKTKSSYISSTEKNGRKVGIKYVSNFCKTLDLTAEEKAEILDSASL